LKRLLEKELLFRFGKKEEKWWNVQFGFRTARLKVGKRKEKPQQATKGEMRGGSRNSFWGEQAEIDKKEKRVNKEINSAGQFAHEVRLEILAWAMKKKEKKNFSERNGERKLLPTDAIPPEEDSGKQQKGQKK